MALKCNIIPKVRNKKTNEIVDSKLFKDLLSFTSTRKDAVDIYTRTKNPKFQELFGEKVSYDENNEPTIKSLIKVTGISSFVPEKNILTTLNRNYSKKDSLNNYSDLVQEAYNFNTSNDFKGEYVASVYEEGDKAILKIEKRTKALTKKSKEAYAAVTLARQIDNLLYKSGVSTGIVTAMEESLGINGVADFSKIKEKTSGIITLIRLAKGERGVNALPEEYAHLGIEATLDNPLTQRLLRLIEKNNLAKEILGEEYEDYVEKYGEGETLSKEAAGKLVAKYIVNNTNIPNRSYKNLLQRVIAAIKSFFSRFNETDFKNAINIANKSAEQIAKSLLSEDVELDLSKITSVEKLYQLNSTLDKRQKVLQKLITLEEKRQKIYQKRTGNRSYQKTQKKIIDTLEEHLKKNHIELGIAEYTKYMLERLTSLKERLDKLNSGEDNSLPEKAYVLRQIKGYLDSFSSVLGDIRRDIKDNPDNYDVSVKANIDTILGEVSDLNNEYLENAKLVFTKFIRPFFGEDFVIPFGKHKGEKVSLEELLNQSNKDISIWDRYLDSMADSSDYLLNSFDQVVKRAKDKGRLNTLDITKKLQAAHIKLEQAGIKDTNWMFHIQEGTSNIIDRYINIKEASKLSQAQQDYYNTVMEIKNELDKKLPEQATYLLNTIKIRKDFVERIKENLKLNGKAAKDIFWEAIKDQWVRRADDTAFGTSSAITDFGGNKIYGLPLFFLQEGTWAKQDLSMDVTSTMIAYAGMANNYDAMHQVIDLLELGRAVVAEGETVVTSRGKPIVDPVTGSYLTKPRKESNMYRRLEKFFEMQVYNRYMADEGTFGNSKIDVAKTLNNIGSMTALNTYALNLLAGISNVATGKVMMRIESFCKQFFTETNTLHADRNYAKNLPAYMAELGNRVKTSKLALWDEYFDVFQDYDRQERDKDMSRKTWFSRGFKQSALYFMNSVGEHWMQNRTSLALADAYKMKDRHGKVVSLWDAMEVQYIDEKNKALGARLVVKEGYTKEDGSKFTDADAYAFQRRVAAINGRMHGLYSKADMNAIQNLGAGRLAIMYRKWIKPSLNRRFRTAHRNFDLDDWEEGYYRSTARFMATLAKDLRDGKLDFATRYNELADVEKANFKRASTEVGHFLLIMLALACIDWDDKDSIWVKRMVAYQLKRLQTELGSQIPGPSMLQEGLKILDSPAASISVVDRSLDILDALNPWNYEAIGGEDAIVQFGRYKGESKGVKAILNSPLVPMNKTIYRGLHPEEAIKFFDRN
jgi:hypothetical protein